MAVLKRKNSRYWYLVLVRGGKQRWLSTKTEDKSQALQMEMEMKSLIDKKREEKRIAAFIEKASGAAVAKRGILIDTAWDKFVSLPGESDRKARTLASKRIIWNHFIEWVKREHPDVESLGDIDRNIAMAYAQHLDGKSAQTYNNHRHNIRGIFHALMYAADIQENPFDVVPTKSAKHVSYRLFTMAEIRKILDASTPQWRLGVLVSLYTGLRFKDVCFLKWECIDNESGIIVVEPFKTERLSKKVKIPMHPALTTALAGHAKDGKYVLPDMAKRYSNRRFQSEFAETLEKCGIKDTSDGNVGFHSLRHTFVTMLEESGASRQVSQKLVGLGSPVMTELYSHDIKTARDAVARLPTILVE